jgi:hypothetical protein
MIDTYSTIRDAIALETNAKATGDEAKAQRGTAAEAFLAAMKAIEADGISPASAKMDIYTELNWRFKIIGANGTTISREGDKPLATINQRFSIALKFKARGCVFAECGTWHDVQLAVKDEDPDADLKDAFKDFMKKASDSAKADLLAFLK